MRSFIAWLIFLPVVLFAQDSGAIYGSVYLEDGVTPAVGANVLIKGTRWGTTADSHGDFVLRHVPPGSYNLEVSYVGYKRAQKSVHVIAASDDSNLRFVLSPSVFQLNEVVVTGTLNKHLLKDAPVLTEVIGQKELSSIGSSNLSEVLQVQTGIEIGTGIGQTQSVSFHGLSNTHVLVLVDGERIAGKIDGAIDLGQIPVNIIDRIEVVKGPLSSIYGSDALGGVVNILTKTPHATRIAASVTGGTLGRQDYDLTAAHVFPSLLGENNDLRLLFNTGWNKFFGVDYDKTDYFMEMPEYDRKNINLKLGSRIEEKLDIDLKAEYYTDKLTWLAGGIGLSYLEDAARNKKHTLSASAQYTFSPKLSLRVATHQSRNDRRSTESSISLLNGLSYPLRDNTSNEQVQTHKMQWTLVPYEESILTAGIEYSREDLISSRLSGGARWMGNTVLYAEDEWKIFGTTFALGGRYSKNSAFGSFFAPRISFMAPLTERTTVRASYGRGYKEPSLLDLYIDYDNSGVGYVVKGEPKLQPEKSHGYNLGMQYNRNDIVWFRLNYYYNDVTNLISYYTVSASTPMRAAILSYRNIDAAVTQGVDIDVDFQPFTGLVLGLGYNYNSAKDGAGRDLPFRTPHSANGKILMTVKDWYANGSLRVRWYGKKPVTDDQVNTNIYQEGQAPSFLYVGSYFVADARIAVTLFSMIDLFAGINNIFDKREYPFGQVKPRQIFGGASITLQ